VRMEECGGVRMQEESERGRRLGACACRAMKSHSASLPLTRAQHRGAAASDLPKLPESGRLSLTLYLLDSD
jgi:hypothetical protein